MPEDIVVETVLENDDIENDVDQFSTTLKGDDVDVEHCNAGVDLEPGYTGSKSCCQVHSVDPMASFIMEATNAVHCLACCC
jgi:hypothetical protein